MVKHNDASSRSENDAVVDWLLDSDPAIRWQDEALAMVDKRRQSSGQWPLDVRHRNTLYEEFAGAVGEPNRRITLRARRVSGWVDHRRMETP